MTKITYKKCPRCELNYIDSRQDMCDICKAELNLAPNTLIEDDEEETKELCPICKVNYIDIGEEMCESCAEELAAKKAEEEEADDWKEFVDEDIADGEEDEAMEIPLEELQDDEFNDSFDDEEEENENYEDDFEEIGDIDGEDFDDDDEEDEDEDF